jgi:hypothetical protein
MVAPRPATGLTWQQTVITTPILNSPHQRTHGVILKLRYSVAVQAKQPKKASILRPNGSRLDSPD